MWDFVHNVVAYLAKTYSNQGLLENGCYRTVTLLIRHRRGVRHIPALPAILTAQSFRLDIDTNDRSECDSIRDLSCLYLAVLTDAIAAPSTAWSTATS